MIPELSSFAVRLRELISHPQAEIGEPQFNSLALELFTVQFKYNPAYRKICEARQLTPQVIKHWTQIPAMPTGAFKELEVTSLAPSERTAVFHSSGTTEQKPSRHFHNAESLAVYEASLWAWFESEALGAGRGASGLIILTPPPELAPHSSLVRMFETIRQNFGDAGIHARHPPFFGKIESDGSWILDFDALLAELSLSAPRPAPSVLFLLGTAFSFVHLLDYLASKDLVFNLPEGSLVMETGGYKNRSRTLPKQELHALITERLGVSRENIICEYGMSELSSQAYDSESQKPEARSQKRVFHFSPWARAQIISPETGCEAGEGEMGLIRVFDLANVFSVAAIQTEDLGIRRGDGFELVGRAQFAEPRGCSLMTA